MDIKLANKIADFANGTCHSESELAEIFNVTEDEIAKAAEISQIERCQQCDWWDESGAIDEDGICDDCRST